MFGVNRRPHAATSTEGSVLPQYQSSRSHTAPRWTPLRSMINILIIGGLLLWLIVNFLLIPIFQTTTAPVTANEIKHGHGDRLLESRTRFEADDGSAEQGRSSHVIPDLFFKSNTPSILQLHGILGHDKQGRPLWVPEQFNSSESLPPMSMLLRQGGGFNLRLSDSLPLDRDVVDSRHDDCRFAAFIMFMTTLRKRAFNMTNAPPMSVIIVFYNEPFSTLFRSVHSVLNRTPPELLHEIILVDDGSNLPWIMQEGGTGFLERYAASLPKTRIVRGNQRKGIVPARMLGIRSSTAPIFVILDSHIEVNEGWAEPIIHRINQDHRVVVMPIIASIDPETFTPQPGGIGCTLGFLWKLIEHGYTPNMQSPRERRHARKADYVPSPTMAGGLFAANRDFFLNDLGGYDEQFSYWGTENLEISFRIWMCGGRLECAPCSVVYHIFRKGGSGYSSPTDAVTKNKMRLLMGWMDEFADLAWRVIGKPRVNFGSVENVKSFREKKQCKSFHWYLETVYPEAEVRDLPADVPYLGPIRHAATKTCLIHHGSPGGVVFLRPCDKGQSTEWMYFRDSEHWMPVLNDESCFGGGSPHPSPNKTDWCHSSRARWSYSTDTGHMILRDNHQCLSVDNDNPEKLIFTFCNTSDPTQEWLVTPYNPPRVFTPPPVLAPNGAGGGLRGVAFNADHDPTE